MAILESEPFFDGEDDFADFSVLGEVPALDNFSPVLAANFEQKIHAADLGSPTSHGTGTLTINGKNYNFNTAELESICPTETPGNFLVVFKKGVGEHKVTTLAVSLGALAACAAAVRFYSARNPAKKINS